MPVTDHLLRPLRLAALAVGLCVLILVVRGGSPWTLIQYFDDINAMHVGIAAVKDPHSAALKVHATTGDSKVWVTFLPPAGMVDTDRGLAWQVLGASGHGSIAVTDAIARATAKPIHELRHAGPTYSSFVIYDAAAPGSAIGLLDELIAGGTLILRWPQAGGGDGIARFDLRGSAAAIAQVWALAKTAASNAP